MVRTTCCPTTPLRHTPPQEGFEERIKGELAQAEARAKVAVQNAVYQEHEKIKADVSQRLDVSLGSPRVCVCALVCVGVWFCVRCV
jgi:hypothetical protein